MTKNDRWNKLYKASTELFGHSVNTLLLDNAHQFQSKRHILNLGDGEGFNSIFLARQGHDVVSLDSSVTAQEKAATNASRMNTSIHFVLSNCLDWQQPDETFDVITLFFVHIDSGDKSKLAANIQRWLKPGGIFLMECFHKENLTISTLGPRDSAQLYDEEEINALFPKLKCQKMLKQKSQSYMETIGHENVCTVQYTAIKIN